jgi:hypothetical protein
MLILKESEILRLMVKTTDDHEKRIRIIERTLAYGAGALGLALSLYKSFVK